MMSAPPFAPRPSPLAPRLLAIAYCLICLTAPAADLTLNLTHFTQTALTNRAVLIIPVQLTPAAGQIAAYDRTAYTSGTNGLITITNMMAGLYQVEIQAPPTKTSFAILFPTNTTGTFRADSLQVAMPRLVLRPQDYSYSSQASDVRYSPGGTIIAALGYTTTNAVTAILAASPLNGTNITGTLTNATTGSAASGWPIQWPASSITNSTWVTAAITNGLASQAYATNAAYAATNGLGAAAFKALNFFDAAGAATAATNGYPWTNVTVASATVAASGWPTQWPASSITNSTWLTPATAASQIGTSNLLSTSSPLNGTNLTGSLTNSTAGRAGSILIQNVVTPSQILTNGNAATATFNNDVTLAGGDADLSVGGIIAGNGSGLTNISQTAIAPPPYGMVLIPAGTFTMGDSLDSLADATPTATTVSAFYMDQKLVTLALWKSVYYWATNHGYGFAYVGSGKAENHPVQTIDWYDCVKWCNARSQQAGKTPVYYTDAGLTAVYTNGEVTVYTKWTAVGYRLPTEAEWEKAARGGVSGQRFPWGNLLISQSRANYNGATGTYAYDLGPDGYNAIGNYPTTSPGTSPVDSFPPNGYGLYDMAGNVWQWCWDWYGTPYAGGTDPRGAVSGSGRVDRGGSWTYDADYCRSAFRGYYGAPAISYSFIGFRSVLPPGQP